MAFGKCWLAPRLAGLFICLARRYYLAASNGELRLGALFPVYKTSSASYAFDSGGHNRFSAFYMAVQEINNRTDGVLDNLHPNLTIKFTFHDSKRSTGKAFFAAAKAVSTDFDEEGVHAIIGAASSGPSANVALVAEQAEIPQISYSASSPGLSNKDNYPYFMRTTAADDYQATAMADTFLNYFGWTNVVIISATDSYSSYGAAALEEQCEALGISVQDTVSILSDWGTDEIQTQLKRIMNSGFKIMVMFIDATVGYNVMVEAQELGMTGLNSGYMWVLSDAMATSNTDNLELLLGADLTGLLLFVPQTPSGEGYEAYVARYRRRPSTLGGCALGQDAAACACSNETDAAGSPLFVLDHDGDGGAATPARCAGWDFAADAINAYNPYAYDAVVVVATAASRMLYAGEALGDGAALLARLLAFSAPNETAAVAAGLVSGALAFDANGDRAAGLGYSLKNYDANQTARTVAAWTSEGGLVLSGEHAVRYPNSNDTVPADWASPTCAVGETLPAGSLVCVECEAGYFSWVPGEETCHRCPAGAGCSGGSGVRVLLGHWRFPNTTGYCHSGDYDGCELYECAVKQACQGDVIVSEYASLSLGSDTIDFSESISTDMKSAINYYCLEDDGTYKSCEFRIQGVHVYLNTSITNAVSRTSLKLSGPYSDHSQGDIQDSELVLMLTEQCAPGYAGNGCDKCDSSANYQKGLNGLCTKCYDHSVLVWFIFFLTICCLLCAGLAVLKMKLEASGKTKERLSIVLKILLSWGQMMAIFQSFGLDWPVAVSKIFASQDAALNSGSNIISFTCVLNELGFAHDGPGKAVPRAMAELLFWMGLPVLTVAAAAGAWAFLCWRKMRKLSREEWDFEHFCNLGLMNEAQDGEVEAHEVKAVLFCLGEDHSEATVAEVVRLAGLASGGIPLTDFQLQLVRAQRSIHRGKAILTIVVMLFILYPTLVTKTFTLFTCVPLATHASYLAIDLDFQCFTPEHTLWIVFLGLPAMLLYVIGIPAAAMNILRMHKHELHKQHIKSRYNFLYDGYKHKCYWWEGVVLLRKVALIAVGVSASPMGRIASGITGLIVVLCVQMLQWWAQPFDNSELNALENASLRAALITYFCGLYFLQNNLNVAFALVLVLVIFAVNGVFLATVFKVGCKDADVIWLKLNNSVADGWSKIAAKINRDEENYKKLRIQKQHELQRLEKQKLIAQQHESLLTARLRQAAAIKEGQRARKLLLQLKEEQSLEAEFQRKQAKAMAGHTHDLSQHHDDQEAKDATHNRPSVLILEGKYLTSQGGSRSLGAEPKGQQVILQLYNRGRRREMLRQGSPFSSFYHSEVKARSPRHSPQASSSLAPCDNPAAAVLQPGPAAGNDSPGSTLLQPLSHRDEAPPQPSDSESSTGAAILLPARKSPSVRAIKESPEASTPNQKHGYGDENDENHEPRRFPNRRPSIKIMFPPRVQNQSSQKHKGEGSRPASNPDSNG